MTPTGRTSALTWINAHAGKVVEISAPGHSVRVRGRIHKVVELDACSTTVYECDIDTGATGLQVTLSLHDDTLALHLIGREAAPQGSEPEALVVMVSLPYAETTLDLPAPRPASPREQAEPQEPEFSPYELLHTRSD